MIVNSLVMTNVRTRVLKKGVFLIVIFACLSQSLAIDYSEDIFVEEFNGLLKNGLLNQIAKSIPEDEGNSVFCVQDLLKWRQDFTDNMMWAITSKLAIS